MKRDSLADLIVSFKSGEITLEEYQLRCKNLTKAQLFEGLLTEWMAAYTQAKEYLLQLQPILYATEDADLQLIAGEGFLQVLANLAPVNGALQNALQSIGTQTEVEKEQEAKRVVTTYRDWITSSEASFFDLVDNNPWIPGTGVGENILRFEDLFSPLY